MIGYYGRMSPVHRIFAAFDNSPKKLAEAIGVPIQTVSDWKNKGREIPNWRRLSVLEAAQRTSVTLPPECIEYLTSTARAEAA